MHIIFKLICYFILGIGIGSIIIVPLCVLYMWWYNTCNDIIEKPIKCTGECSTCPYRDTPKIVYPKVVESKNRVVIDESNLD